MKKMKEQQKHNCTCHACGRKRTVIEEELEILYDAYYEELENFSINGQSKKGNELPFRPNSPKLTSKGTQSHYRKTPGQMHRYHYEAYGASDDDDDFDESEEDSNQSDKGSIFEFGSGLTSKGNLFIFNAN